MRSRCSWGTCGTGTNHEKLAEILVFKLLSPKLPLPTKLASNQHQLQDQTHVGSYKFLSNSSIYMLHISFASVPRIL